MADKRQFYGSFKMKPLPKQEYALLKAMQDFYEISDPSDFITLLIRLSYEVHHVNPGWFRNVIDTWKNNPDEVRTYEL